MGNLLQSDNSFKLDCALKRGKFIGKIHTLLQEFHFTSPEVLTHLIRIYTTSFYSSSLWSLFSPQVEKLFTSWNITIRMVFKLPNMTHRYLIESVSNCPHVKVMLSSRFIQFHKSLMENKKSCIRLLSNLCVSNLKTKHGRNLSQIQRDLDCSEEELSSFFIKNKMQYKTLPDKEQWRLPLLLNLLEIRNNSTELPHFVASVPYSTISTEIDLRSFQ